jgi:2-polyprenyl-3-methyl-5-hydroxy-6-metoxy-1,4-benzoquinol methylase
MSNLKEQLQKAQDLISQNRFEESTDLLLTLKRNYEELSPICDYCLAQISNMVGDPETAYKLYYQAFTDMPDIASRLYADTHSSSSYVFSGMRTENERTDCPLCGFEAAPHWCYPLTEATGYNFAINPIRLWMYCEPCHHMFACHFPERVFDFNDAERNANPIFFSYYSDVLSTIRGRGYATGMSLFEIGIGASECLLAAREIGYDVFGIDVIERHVEDAKNRYGLNVATADFVEFETDEKYDVVIMGDVLEHVSDPILAVKKAESLIKQDGAIWVSTPTFESAFSAVVGHNDPMRRQQYHLNYFSRQSLYGLFNNYGLIPVEYNISSHYNGSMEVIFIKESRV